MISKEALDFLKNSTNKPPIHRLSNLNLPNVIDANWLLTQDPSSSTVKKILGLVPEGIYDQSTMQLKTCSRKEKLMVYAASLLVAGGFFWMPIALYVVYKKCDTKEKKRYFWIGISLICISVLFFRRSTRFRNTRFWDPWMKYLRVAVIGEDLSYFPPSPTDRASMVAATPHGIFPYAQGLLGVDRKLNYLFGQLRIVIATNALLAPVFGHVGRLLDSLPAEKKPILSSLKNLGADRSVCIIPGGVAEMFEMRSCTDFEYLKLKGRTGWIKLAIEAGAPILPSYTFGNSRLMTLLSTPYDFLRRVSQKVKAGVVLFKGKNWLPIPQEVPLSIVVGRKIITQQDPSPSSDYVNQVHRLFIREIMRLFETYKHYYGWGDRKLIVV